MKTRMSSQARGNRPHPFHNSTSLAQCAPAAIGGHRRPRAGPPRPGRGRPLEKRRPPSAPLLLSDLPGEILEVMAGAVDQPAAHVALVGIHQCLHDGALATPCSPPSCTRSGHAARRTRRRRCFTALARRSDGRRTPERAEAGFPSDTAAAVLHLLAAVARQLSNHKRVRL